MIEMKLLGKTLSGEDVYLYTLKSNCGSVQISSLGASIQSIVVPDKSGNFVDVALGFNTVSAMEDQKQFVGATIGRCANRLRKGKLVLGDELYQLPVNDGPNHLHGGNGGFHNKIWHGEMRCDHIVFSRLSTDGEEGYPGNLQVSVTYRFDDKGKLSISYDAICDKDTVVNLTNHTYFNLSGHKDGDITGHLVRINSSFFTGIDSYCLPNGSVISVQDTPMDFRSLRSIGGTIDNNYKQLKLAGGYDHNYILSQTKDKLEPAAYIASPKTGIAMEVFTDMPGMQFYTGNNIKNMPLGKDGAIYARRSGFCMETQFWPNAVAHSSFPSPVLPAGVRYTHTTYYQFGTQ